jgi:hypothetical protein
MKGTLKLMSDKIIDLFASSAVTQGALSIILVGGWIYMLAVGIAVPDAYTLTVGTVIGFFFGGKLTAAAQRSKEAR